MSLAYLAVPVSGVAIVFFILRILGELMARFLRGAGFMLGQPAGGAGEAK
jgi:TRAP-type C4-dicarboxylate transport system permease small subunit